MLRWSLRLLIVWILLCASSCAPVLGAVATGGVDMIKDREKEGVPNDELITVKIQAELAQKDVNHMFSLISVKVETGRVMLTGVVQNAEVGTEAVQIAQGVDGVTQVINELTVSGATTATTATTAATATGSATCNNDDLITNEILNQMLRNKDINAVNYSVETLKGVVYVIGTAQTPQELEAVLNIANSIKDVKRVINHVLLATDLQQTPVPQTQKVQAVPVVPTVATTSATASAAASVPSTTAANPPVTQAPGNTLDAELAKQKAQAAVKSAADNAPVKQPVTPVAQNPGNTLDAELANQQKAKAAASPVGKSLSEEEKTIQLNTLSTPAKLDSASAAKPAAVPADVAPVSPPAAKTVPADNTASAPTQSTASPTDASTDKGN